MAALPYMQFYVADYLADTAHLSTLQHGAYMMLLMNYWQRGKPLPSKDEYLAQICRLSLDQWLEIKPIIAEFFTERKDTWTHKRIDIDLQKVMSKSTKLSEAGKASGAKRKSNKCSTNVEQKPIYTDTEAHTEAQAHTEADTDIKKEEKPKPAPISLGMDALRAVLRDDPKYLEAIDSGSPPDELRLAAEVMHRHVKRQVGIERKSWIEAARTAWQNIRNDPFFANQGGLMWLLDVKEGAYNGRNAYTNVAKHQIRQEVGGNSPPKLKALTNRIICEPIDYEAKGQNDDKK